MRKLFLASLLLIGISCNKKGSVIKSTPFVLTDYVIKNKWVGTGYYNNTDTIYFSSDTMISQMWGAASGWIKSPYTIIDSNIFGFVHSKNIYYQNIIMFNNISKIPYINDTNYSLDWVKKYHICNDTVAILYYSPDVDSIVNQLWFKI